MPVPRMVRRNNTEGSIGPVTSSWGQRWWAGTPQMIDHPPPIGNFRKAFGGTIGSLLPTSANVRPLITVGGYGGDLPDAQRPLVDAPDPWMRP